MGYYCPCYPVYNQQMMDGNNMRMGPHQPNECANCQNIQKSMWYCQKKITHLLYFFSQKQLQELARQRDMYLQLLMQNLMLSKDKQFKYKNYCLLFTFSNLKDRALSQYPNLPKYTVPFIKHPVTRMPMTFSPQLSIFQSPLLELSHSIYKRLLQDHSAEGVRSFLQKCALINSKLLPITKNSISGSISRRKFTLVDDYLLLIGLEEFGYKEIQNVQKKWLPEKNVKEIKHRYKNLTCCKANENIIKTWKKADEQKLTKEENDELWKGFSWFGSINKIPLIVKYFLPNRSHRVVIRETQKLLNEGRRLDEFHGRSQDEAKNNDRLTAQEETKKTKNKAKECLSIMDYIKAYESGNDHFAWEKLTIESANDDEWAANCKTVLSEITPDNICIIALMLSLIHICRCRRYAVCRSRWSPYH
eukprot:TRINITY_DN12941_c0_g2_i4.p1 TRINITY_DN12941_c0_g2~~TRINITY_DN12941_c0_g2_i4.p1  ORF type:complete len:418 (+),score=119.20 TRINITY_DN12941_c0_g2_i4:636-1889(+)